MMDLTTKKKIISDMNDAYSKLNDIVVDLLMAREAAKQESDPEKEKKMTLEAKQGLIKVKAKRSELGAAIDELISSAIDDWLEQVEAVTASIEGAKSTLKTIEKNIEERKKLADNVIGVIGVVDDLIEVIAKVV
jgi:uncharacterized protein YicC (UPF0701 family)